MNLNNYLTAAFVLMISPAFAQDTTRSKITFKKDPVLKATVVPAHQSSKKDTSSLIRADDKKTKIRYRPTRLGSSSAKYNTYKKNKMGAGAVTTNRNKARGTNPNLPVVKVPDSLYHNMTDSIP